ncbi:MAG: hypothetical protein H0U74_23315 [Bradymonadaceae bacterium]|nr:hypothetical protein [Lujinxingiaceae bacterium]
MKTIKASAAVFFASINCLVLSFTVAWPETKARWPEYEFLTVLCVAGIAASLLTGLVLHFKRLSHQALQLDALGPNPTEANTVQAHHVASSAFRDWQVRTTLLIFAIGFFLASVFYYAQPAEILGKFDSRHGIVQSTVEF